MLRGGALGRASEDGMSHRWDWAAGAAWRFRGDMPVTMDLGLDFEPMAPGVTSGDAVDVRGRIGVALELSRRASIDRRAVPVAAQRDELRALDDGRQGQVLMPANRSITAEWQPPRWWSRYNRGVVTRMTGLDSVSGIWRRTETGEIRIYTADAIDGEDGRRQRLAERHAGRGPVRCSIFRSDRPGAVLRPLRLDRPDPGAWVLALPAVQLEIGV